MERLFQRPSPAPDDGVDDAFWVAVRRLPKRQRQVLCLRYVEDMSVSEIAAEDVDYFGGPGFGERRAFAEPVWNYYVALLEQRGLLLVDPLLGIEV